MGGTSEVELVMIVSEPGDPQSSEAHEPHLAGEAMLASACRLVTGLYREHVDQYHRNIRLLLELCWPGITFDEKMRRVWITESVLCSAAREGAAEPLSLTSISPFTGSASLISVSTWPELAA